MKTAEPQVLYDWDTDRFGSITLHMNWGDLDNEMGEHREIYIQGEDAAAALMGEEMKRNFHQRFIPHRPDKPVSTRERQ